MRARKASGGVGKSLKLMSGDGRSVALHPARVCK